MSDLYDKLSYVPLPNLKICLKKYLKDEDQRDKVDKYTKSEVITKFRSLNLKDTDILDIYTQYKFGKNLSFQLFYTNRNLGEVDFSLSRWQIGNNYKSDLSNVKYESLPRVKDLKFTDIENLDNNILEFGYKYHSLHKYFNDTEQEEPSYIYETQYGFLWINKIESYIIVISKDEKIVQIIKDFIYKNFDIKLIQPQLTKEILNKIFLPENTKSATYTETLGATAKVSYPSTAKEYNQISENVNTVIQQMENSGIRKANGRYQECITEGEKGKSIISVNADKCRISILKTYSANEIRNWGKEKFSLITNELNNMKLKDISQFFDIFSKEILEDYRLPKDDISNIKKICGALYNAVIKKKNYEIPNLNIYSEKFDISKYFNIIPLFDCPACGEMHYAKCYNCDVNYEWKKGLFCPKCKNIYADKVYLKCDNGQSNEISVYEAITLTPNSKLLEILARFIVQTKENFDIKHQGFYIRNNKLIYFHNISSTELSIKELSTFESIDTNLQINNPNEYKTLKNECKQIPEKCKSSQKTNCSNCLSNPSLSCLMKMFAYIETSYKPQPHKGGEYGDASFVSEVNNSQQNIKIIMKSEEKNGIVLPSTRTGREIIVQLITQYMRDSYNPILMILTPSQIDGYLKADIRNLVKLKNGKVVFAEEKEFIGIYKLAKAKGYKFKE